MVFSVSSLEDIIIKQYKMLHIPMFFKVEPIYFIANIQL